MQSTAMGETLYLAFFVWAVVFFTDWIRGSNSLTKCALCIAATCLTRYDGWFLGGAMMIAVVAIWFGRAHGTTRVNAEQKRGRALLPAGANEKQTRALVTFLLIAAAAPALWLAYNAIVYRNPLEFANGPYSAKAIEQKTSRPGYPPHPGTHNLPVAGSYFLKSAELNLAAGKWQRMWIVLLLMGTAMSLIFNH